MRYVVTLRDPKDTYLSLYRFFDGWLMEPGGVSLDEFFPVWLGGGPGGCDYATHLLSWYGPHKTLYNRWKRWGERGIFLRMMEGLAAASATPKTIMINATYLKAHRTASSLRVKKGVSGGSSAVPKEA